MAKTNETFIVQASLMIITYDLKNMFIVQATGVQHHQDGLSHKRVLHDGLEG